MFEDDSFDMFRYEVGIIINDNRDTICATDDLEIANNFYEDAIKTYSPTNSNNHAIIFLYDYNKNTNINYYDNESECS